MREIKFRMWNNVKDNTKASKMFYEISEVMNCLKQQLYYDNQVIGRLGYNHIGDGNVFMQYTGLKDKNGTEIYEGDVVTYYNKYSDMTYKQIVKWDEMFAGFGLFEKDNKWCKESDWMKIQHIYIVGNIYENQELIK